jgi:hypothetical protein
MKKTALLFSLSALSLSSCIVVNIPVAPPRLDDSSFSFVDPHDTLKSHVNCANGGFHFLSVLPTGEYAAMAPKMGFGFDIEAYSKNLSPKKKVATYLGADLMVAWKDRTDKISVDVIGSPVKGTTSLANSLIASHFNARFEMNKKKFRPYLLGSIGWLGFATDQMVRANNTTNSTNSVIMGTLNTSVNLGFRYFIQKQVALDCRLGYNMTSATRIGEIQHAVYDPVGTIYNMPDVALNPNFFTFKIGFLFCLSSDRHSNAQSSYYRDNYYRSRSYTPSYNVPKPIIKPAVPIMQN